MTRKIILTSMTCLAGWALASAAPAQAQQGSYFGDIIVMGTSYCPRNFLEADGRSLLISDYETLHALIGNAYGGDATHFNLPNLQGRSALHRDSGAGIPVGASIGLFTNTMTTPQTMPNHTHTANASTAAPNQTSPEGHALASFPSGPDRYATNAANTVMEPDTVAVTTGGGASFNNVGPSQVVRYCIAVQNVQWPSRN